MNSVSGLQSALRLYSSDKIKDRSQGLEQIREIFSNRENLAIFQETASKEGGAGWIAFYQCLFQVVVMEKKAVVKRGASTQADKRLADSISLVRWMTERTVHLLSRKPFIALFTHLTQMLVFASQIFPPAALDYAKALRSLLLYTPHLENLDQGSWKVLMGICWAAVLGDEVRVDDDWEDEDQLDDMDQVSKRSNDDFTTTQAGPSTGRSRTTISQANSELITLIPILLSSTAAPLLPPLPTKEATVAPVERVGLAVLLKIHCFFHQFSAETSAHLAILRSLNIVLAELELSCRDDFLSAGLKLFPQLVSLWGTRNKAIREQVVISLRMLLPFVTHRTLGGSKQAPMVRETLEQLMDALSKETISKSGVEPMDLNVLRLNSLDGGFGRGPFELRSLSAGFEFSHEHSMTWAVLELYRDSCIYLHESQSLTHPATPSREGRSSKRRRVDNSLTSLIIAIDAGSHKSRLLALQVLIFVVNSHWDKLHAEAQSDVRKSMLDLLDEDDDALQSWAYIGLSIVAQLSHETQTKSDSETNDHLVSPSHRLAQRRLEEGDWMKVWIYVLRKCSVAATCRAASHAATIILSLDKIDRARVIKDIHNLLANVDIQGPIFPYDSVCAFLSKALELARSDVRLYSLELEDKVLSWLGKCEIIEGPRGKNRMEQHTPADILRLLSAIARIRYHPLGQLTTAEVLPDAAIVDRILEEAKTKPIRDFLLYGIFPTSQDSKTLYIPAHDQNVSTESLAFLEGRPRRVSSMLIKTLQSTISEWETTAGPTAPPERIRRCIDLIVLSLGYQGSLQLNGHMSDIVCIQETMRLLQLVQPLLVSHGLSIPAQHLIWKGFDPLVQIPVVKEETWPMMIKPDVQSGIRQDLLPPAQYDTAVPSGESSYVAIEAGGSRTSQAAHYPSQIPASGLSQIPPTPITPSTNGAPPRPLTHGLSSMIWQLPTIASTFKELFSLCKQFVEKSSTAVQINGTQAPYPGQIDDDDFGEIRTAETDAMPLSKEAMECQRTSRSLLDTVFGLRLKGNMLIINSQRPYKDSQLVDALLSSEGSRFIDIGRALCRAVSHDWLRLGTDAVELVLECLEEMFVSYAYSRDEGLLCLCLDFARCSAPVWLGPEAKKSGLGRTALYFMTFLSKKIDRGLITSWRARLAMLRFLDDFLHEDAALQLWQEASDEDMEMEGREPNPLFHLAGALLDIDSRVRMRAATSAAAVFYRPILPPLEHRSFYFGTLSTQPGDDKHFDSFVSHLLWKINCCIATAQQRSAVVFHLYEVPAVTANYNHHLQAGLIAATARLGLTSISSLYLPYALIVIRSQLREGQLAMRIPHKLYGFSTRKAFSATCVASVGPAILASREVDFFISACDAAGVTVEHAVVQHFPAAAAQFFAESFGKSEQDGGQQAAREAIIGLTCLPGMESKEKVGKQLASSIEGVVASLWELVDLESSTDEIMEFLGKVDSTTIVGSVFAALMINDVSMTGGTAAVEPSSSVDSVISAYLYLRKQFPSLSTSKVVFSSILQLTDKINNVFLVSEQRRCLRALALVIVLHQSDLQDPTILRMFLREMLAILPQPDLCGIALSMVEWGFDQLQLVRSAPPNLVDLFVQLGSARVALSDGDEHCREVGEKLEAWVVNRAGMWTLSGLNNSKSAEDKRVSTAIVQAFEAGLALWPETLRSRISDSYSPLLVDLCTLAESTAVKHGAELCKQYQKLVISGVYPNAIPAFVQSQFWYLKDKLATDDDSNGANAFLDILYRANGQVHPPALDAMSNFAAQTGKGPIIMPKREQLVGGKLSKVVKDIKTAQAELRASLVLQVFRLTESDDHGTRASAFRVLQGMLPMLQDSLGPTGLLASVSAALSVLTPIPLSSSTSTEGQKAPSLIGTINTTSWIKCARSVDHWARDLIRILCEAVSADDEFYSSLEPLLATPNLPLTNFLPYLVQATLTCGADKSSETSMERSKALSEHFTMVLQWPSASVATVQTILDVILHLRHYQPFYRNERLGYNAWLEVDYLLLSNAAAIKCGAYATSMLFLELARDQERQSPVELSNSTVQQIMYEIYSNVEDPDGFYGIQNHDVRDALLRRLQHEGQSNRAFGWNGALIETSTSRGESLLPALHNLHDFGFNQLASAVASQSQRARNTAEDDTDPLFFELAWRTGDWDLPMTEESSKTSQGVLYSALRAVHRERDVEAALRIVQKSVGVEIKRLGGLGMERMAQIKNTTANLLCLRETANWLDPSFQVELETASGLGGRLSGFCILDDAFDFSNAEKITATRLSLLQSARQREQKNVIGDLLSPKMETIVDLEKSVQLRLSQIARENSNLQAAVNSITAVQQLEKGVISEGAQDAFSHVLWAQGEHGLAIQYLSDLVEGETRSHKSNGSARLAVLLARKAHWTSRAKLRAASEIKKDFDSALSFAAKQKIDRAEHARICYQFACFADGHYANLSKSPELERLKAYHDRRTSELESTLKSSSRRESSSRQSRAEQDLAEDAEAIRELESDRSTYIRAALKMYAAALALSDAHDDSVTRMISLWLEHSDNEEVNQSFSDPLSRIPSHKFVFLGPQLAARLNRPQIPTTFNSSLNGLMLRISRDHPFHILYQVITLAYGVTPPSSDKRKSTSADSQGRGPAAAEILATLQTDKGNSTSSKAAKNMKMFAQASVAWAKYDENAGPSQERSRIKAGTNCRQPPNSPLRGLTRLDIPIATCPPRNDLTCQYSGLPTLSRYREGYKIAGGVHRPKIMGVYDTLQKVHQQLFKAEDEVRQDAVMEQVFTMTNDLLTRDRRAKERNLRFRTYNVVPFPDKTGVIEFVEGTTSIGFILKPFHEHYGTGLTNTDIQSKLSKIQDRDPNSAELPKQYAALMKKFPPVMRHFFAYKHRDPMAWFAMRLNYSRSVAVTSIVGWMVGLGDRHCSNILLDETSGELVHIDFGIVFEDGRKLRIPEKVPFRLTNDLVDGLGLTGVEGTFRRCAEHTLRVLRDASDLILTVLEVFKHDPLYAWAGDPDKLQRAQGGGRVISNDANVREKADRVLGKIRGKLAGDLSVEYTVNQLIMEARDVENLAKIYHGWAAWF
ncbi:hypothetical protein CI109_105716 [Kwoniella shandongensis]|uniref:Serine/threonine-protein kinase Tel1 n=1 Tax=Kwoniella shandongensis TaxID=1734106 RepID=A0A5M6C0K6_9TREE|nr:uncharacterized protein CI109_003056 [Kwoniella shandongensis]KAA5528524.1 hypothetical protein CI109_003056 [Kwoniella shandongensis]